MARVTFVQKAQARFEMVTVLDEDGQPKRTPVMRNGTQKMSKRGPVFMTVTVQDRTKPLPNYRCDRCGIEIEVGQPYKHVTPKSGPYGGNKKTRCDSCPVWQVWELSNSTSARCAEIVYNFERAVHDAQSPDDFKSAQDDAASEIRDIATEKTDGADNIESGFGHETQMSQELRELADLLEGWADEVEGYEPETPEPSETECDECNGEGVEESSEGDGVEIECEECGGSGTYTPDEPTEDQIDEWRDETLSSHPINDCPA